MTNNQKQNNLSKEIVDFITECQSKENPSSYLIAVLHKVQDTYGYLSVEHLEEVSQRMQIPAAKVSGVASFYHFFNLKPRGKYIIQICKGTACHVKGADLIAEKLKEELGIEFGETTKDGLFTLEATRCLGTCALAPVIQIDGKVYPKVTPDQVPQILENYFPKK
ncbi:MAG TPA: NADH-quinone oxidoreductase subunit NuoE [Chlamydiales bacterium]|nr:NADH-quinone oxidoreductase subunit NuoE [Chlamydiales bacterium]